MLSKFELMYNLDTDMLGIILERNKDPKIGSEIKVYIPRIMQNIPKDVLPEPYPSSVTYSRCFVNASDCAPRLSANGFTEQNYIVSKLENSTDLKPLMDYLRDDKTGDLMATYVDKDKMVRCTFMNGKLSQLRLNTDDNLENQSTDVDPHKYF